MLSMSNIKTFHTLDGSPLFNTFFTGHLKQFVIKIHYTKYIKIKKNK